MFEYFSNVFQGATTMGTGFATYEAIDSLAPHAQKAQHLGQRAIEHAAAGDYKSAGTWGGFAVILALTSVSMGMTNNRSS